jgi:hypothetical protein
VRAFAILSAALLVAPVMPVAAQCQLCGVDEKDKVDAKERVALHIEVETGLDFSRIVPQSGDGAVQIDPRTGAPRSSGGVQALGGVTLRGTVRLTGEPFAAVRIDLPAQIQLRSPTGALAEVREITTDLGPAPRLGGDGTLSFGFGGNLIVKGALTGAFRGSIPITADYQ